MNKVKFFCSVFLMALTKQFILAQTNLASNLVNVAKIINYDVVVKDTSTLKHQLKHYGDSLTKLSTIIESGATQYIDPLTYKQFINVIKKYLNDKNAFAVNYDGKQIKTDELKQRIHRCDSVDSDMVDQNGNTYIVRMRSCDSTSMFENNTILNFTEVWSIDSKTYEFKKEVLSYTLKYWDWERDYYREFLTIYKNKAALDFINSLTR